LEITGAYGMSDIDIAFAVRDELKRLEKYEKLVQFIANDYHELSYDKAYWQRDYWKKRCKKLIEEDHAQSNN
jgi:hypothetical protein